MKNIQAVQIHTNVRMKMKIVIMVMILLKQILIIIRKIQLKAQ